MQALRHNGNGHTRAFLINIYEIMFISNPMVANDLWISQMRMPIIAKLIPEVMFREDNTPGYTRVQIAVLSFELMDVLGNLEPGSDASMARAKAFHAEVARRQANQGGTEQRGGRH
jgi:hypothetical protein